MEHAPPAPTYFVKWYRSNKILPTNPRFRAPSATDYWNFTTPADPPYGTQALTWTDSLLVGESETYTPVGRGRRQGHPLRGQRRQRAAPPCGRPRVAPEILSATNADGSAGGTVPATLSLTLGTPATFGAFTPGITKTYEASTTANVISTAGDALLSVADPSSTATGHLVNGTFSLPQPLQARARNAANTGTAYNNVGSQRHPLNLLTYSGPISNDAVALQFSQLINANRRAAHRRVQQDADLHAQHHDAVDDSQGGRR